MYYKLYRRQSFTKQALLYYSNPAEKTEIIYIYIYTYIFIFMWVYKYIINNICYWIIRNYFVLLDEYDNFIWFTLVYIDIYEYNENGSTNKWSVDMCMLWLGVL